jgi:serine/threonine protein kinase
MLAALAGPSPGMMLGKYQVLRHLATGGMAEIFLARTIGMERFERYVVVKCIKPEYAANTQFVEMFLDEARISAQLHNQHIAQVFDIGIENGVLYFAMEYVHGQNAQAILQTVALGKTVIPLEHALTIVIGAAQGLSYAHDKVGADGQPLELVHRDVTPTNILVSYDGAVKVVDFGIVKAATRSTQTRSGVLKGKLAYMSPEQCRSAPLDRRSDVFALGILLYELTTTRRLFAEESDYETMNRIVTGDIPPPRRHRADYPDELAAIVMRCLAVAPAERYPTAEALLEDLLAFARHAGLAPTAIGLSRYMRELFGRQAEPWIGIDLPPTPILPAPTPSFASPPTPPISIVSDSIVSAPPRRRAPVIIGAFAVAALAGGAAIFIGTRDASVPTAAPVPPPVVREASTPVAPPPVVAPAPVAVEVVPPPQPPPEPAKQPAVTTHTRRDKKPKATPRTKAAPVEATGSASEKLRDGAILKPPD